AGVLNDMLYTIGGDEFYAVAQTNVYCYDGTNWLEVAGLPAARVGLAAGVLNGVLYASGGCDIYPRTNVYRYPLITGIDPGVSPSSGSYIGGYPVVITGTNLGDGADITNVTLCGVSATIQSQSATQIVVTAGASPPCTGDVQVYSTSYGVTVKSNAFSYIYYPVLTVVSSYGVPNPGVGVHTNDVNAILTNSVSNIINDGTTQYVCYGWIMIGNVPDSGVTNSFVMTHTNNATLTWLWNTNYWINLQSKPSGHVITPPNGWYPKDTLLSCQAFTTNYCIFDCWTNDIVSTNNPLNLTVTGPAQLDALYIEEMTTNSPTPKWWLDQYGWATNFESAVMSDTDNDGLQAWQEYLADTDPTSSTSTLAITDIVFEESGIRILWSGGQNSSQFLEKSDYLNSTGITWTNLFTNLPPTTVSTNYIDIPGTNQTRFYRIRAVR
ncbi:MAG: IPT/TIG domain-containing protein, partial [Kiritimatiellae bacterium]|nr:IPT/TIG domain-containing protein [Kiritimatiellia bacterium]